MGLYRAPQAFLERLKNEFGEDIRVRWSDKWTEWQVEQKVRRAAAVKPIGNDPHSDDNVRWRDGFMWIMSIKNGTKFPCPKCGLTLKAPTRETVYISCEHCRLKGYDHNWIASFWPMDDILIEHLKKLKYELDHPVDYQGKDNWLRSSMERRVVGQTADKFRDDFSRVVGNPVIGYTGKVFGA